MAASDAKAIPIKNQAYRVYFPLLDADGDLVTGAAGLDSEVSIDGGTFADCSAEATEIATSSGFYYLDLTAAEMNGDAICIIVKTSTSGAKTTPIVLYTAARSINDLAFPTTTGRSIDVATTGEVGVDFSNVNGTLDAAEIGSGAITSAKFAAGAIDATAIADGAIDAATFAAGAINAAAIATDAITAAKIAADAIGASELAADAVTEIQSGLATSAALATIQADTDDIQTRLPSALVGGKMDSHVNDIAAGAITSAAVATDAIDNDAIAANAVTEIQSGLATSAALATVQADTDDIQTRLPTALVGGRMDSSVGAVANNAITAAAIAADAIGASELAADAVTEIQSGVTVTTNNDKTGYALSAAGVDAILDDPLTELSAVPAAAPTLRQALQYVYQRLRNKQTTTNTQTKEHNAAGTVVGTAAVSDAGGTTTRDAFA